MDRLIDRFRANLVVNGEKPFSEDDWKTINIGNLVFKVSMGKVALWAQEPHYIVRTYGPCGMKQPGWDASPSQVFIIIIIVINFFCPYRLGEIMWSTVLFLRKQHDNTEISLILNQRSSDSPDDVLTVAPSG